jgi:oligopeptide/dipeptide ABC transporter ATP-binding protein
MADTPLLDVRHLRVEFPGPRGALVAVDDVSFRVDRGETVGLVGESGCGKTTTMLAVARLLPPTASITGGEVRLDGVDLLDLSVARMRELRWSRIAIVFQHAQNALDPVRTIRSQIAEAITTHRATEGPVDRRVDELLGMVGIPARRADGYPHQFSGGMRQRAMIALALACEPDLLIADEPTTAIDAMIQAQVIDLLRDLQSRLGMSLIVVTHDLGVVSELCDRVIVMYGGTIVEQAPTRELVADPRHPYARLLLDAFPSAGSRQELRSIPGSPPRLDAMPSGCAFHPRCPWAFGPCPERRPPPYRIGAGREAACLLHDPAEALARA